MDMNHMKQILISLVAATGGVLAVGQSLQAQQTDVTPDNQTTVLADTVPRAPYAPVDSALKAQMQAEYLRWHELKMLARPKGSSVALRWAPDGYPAWRTLCGYGYNLLRVEYQEDGSFEIDTIAHEIRPWSQEKFMDSFEPSDSIAGAATTLVHSRSTHEALTSMEAVMRTHDEQESRYSFAMLVADLRFDLAKAMALGYEDYNVQPGRHYEYILQPAMDDSIMAVRSAACDIINEAQKPEPYDPVITDSITDAKTITLYWPYDTYTAYDIEMRGDSTQWKWQRVNEQPYMMLSALFDPGTQCNFYDVQGLEPGAYEFRICAYDAFSEKTNYSSVHKASMPDLIPPSAPLLRYFEIDRSQKPKVFANIHWRKEVFEDDFAGFDVFYYHETMGNEWMKMNRQLIAPQDTVFRCEVSGLASGYVVVQAVDTAGNSNPSTAYEIHIADLEPPTPPTGIGHTMLPNGVVKIHWKPNPEIDVRNYELFAANDTTHAFLAVSGSLTRDTVAYDTLQVVGVNQRYIYYALRAYDYSGNRSEMSEVYQVERLNYTKPELCRFDSLWQDERHIYTRWFKAQNEDVKHYRVFRRLNNQKEWSLIQVIRPEMAVGNFITVDDEVDYEDDASVIYAIETVNFTDISSGLCTPIQVKHWGPAIRDIAVNLKGKYLTEDKVVELTWTVPKGCPDDYYFVLSSDKGRGDGSDPTLFTRIESIPAGTLSKRIYWLKRGATARFYVEIYWRDRSRGIPSEIVTITNPYAPDPDEKTEE